MPNPNRELDEFDSFNDLNDAPRGKAALPEPREDGDPDEGDDVEIDIVDDTPVRDRNARPLNREVVDPTDEELADYGERARKRIGELTHARHDERRRAEAVARERDEAVRVSQQLMARNQEYESIIKNGSEQYSKVSVEAAEAAVKDAKSKLRAAKEAFDIDAEVEAQAELNAAQMRVTEAKNFRPPTTAARENEVKTPAQTDSRTAAPLHDKTRSWMDRNKWFSAPGNEEVTSFALGLHKKLVDSGYDTRSDEYFEQIDARIKAKFPEVLDLSDDEPRNRQDLPSRRSASVVAPASRTTATKRITLTASQVAIAKSLGVTPQQYAAQLIKEAKNG